MICSIPALNTNAPVRADSFLYVQTLSSLFPLIFSVFFLDFGAKVPGSGLGKVWTECNGHHHVCVYLLYFVVQEDMFPCIFGKRC